MQLGLLDVSGRIEDALELAPIVERLGYTRYWIAEHQPQPSPILMAGLIAGQTERIRVGTAGVLLHYVPPLRTAHDFRFLARVFPDRIDAGFCAGLTMETALVEADRDGRDLAALISAYPDRVAQLARHVRAEDPALAWSGGDLPQLWSLGGGPRSAEVAARNGTAFGYSLLTASSADTADVVRRYRETFVPHADLAAPVATIAVCGVCAETDREATAIAATLGASAFFPRVVGSAASCATQLAELADRFAVDEIVFADLLPTIAARVRCHQLLADQVRGRGIR